MAVTVANVKKYLRIDDVAEDDLIKNFLDTAESYVRNAISNYDEYYESSERFQAQADVLIMVLVGEQFYNRDGRNDPRHDFSFVVRSMVNQLQWFVAGDTS